MEPLSVWITLGSERAWMVRAGVAALTFPLDHTLLQHANFACLLSVLFLEQLQLLLQLLAPCIRLLLQLAC